MQSAPEATHAETLWNRRYEPNVAEVNQLCDSLMELKPGSEVPYIDPQHDVDEARIVSLFSNNGPAHPSGFITAGSDIVRGQVAAQAGAENN